VKGSVINVSPSKTPIVPINRDFMPRDEEELERCERTVYVNQIDRAVPGSTVEAMFENTCGVPSAAHLQTPSFVIPARVSEFEQACKSLRYCCQPHVH
jgi:hypothetical protein